MVEQEWIDFAPELSGKKHYDQFSSRIAPLLKSAKSDLPQRLQAANQLREELGGQIAQATVPVSVRAACLVLADLIAHGWSCRESKGLIKVGRPLECSDTIKERLRVQHQLHVERNRQLQTTSVSEFVDSMERRRLYRGRWVSIFSLMRDGGELAAQLRSFLKSTNGEGYACDLQKIVKPYIQVINGEELCHKTGLRLIDIWRYFRHTWSNPYNSVPGRSFMVLIRDAAADLHPVIGLGALASSAVQIAVRDSWIGWTPEQQLEQLRKSATEKDVQRLVRLISEGLEEMYLDDFLDPSTGLINRRLLASPTSEAIKALNDYARQERIKHQKLVHQAQHKRDSVAWQSVIPSLDETTSENVWKRQAESPLFRGKRAETLAMFLRARTLLCKAKRHISSDELRKALQTGDAKQAIQSLLRRAKSQAVGVAMADLSVCGAIAPYTSILGGKLVAMMMTSPEIVLAYKTRYAKAQSIIASSMAGRPVIRPPKLVLLGTTSLYGTEPTQYTRVHIPCDKVGGRHHADVVRYELLGRTEGFGTSQFSSQTADTLTVFLSQRGGQRVHNIFGEGVNPRLRKIRDGLNLLNLDADYLLEHGSPRLVYGIALARNFRRYLLGKDKKPSYYFPLRQPSKVTEQIAAWWMERWLFKRIQRDSVLNEIGSQVLSHPVQHGARVPRLLDDTGTLPLFDNL